MNSKVIGKTSSALAYFGSLLIILSFVCLVLFIAQVAISGDGLVGRLFTKDMIYLQLLLLCILGPSLLFCSYLTLSLNLSSRFFCLAVRAAGILLLPIFPCVSWCGLYALWLSRKTRK